MARVFRLTFFVLLGAFAVLCPLRSVRASSPPPQGVYPDEGTASANCEAMAAYLGTAWKCTWRDPSPGVYTNNTNSTQCSSLKYSAQQWAVMNGTTVGPAYMWCVPADCSVYDAGQQVYWTYMADGSQQCIGGCSGAFHMTDGARNPLSGEGWSSGTFSPNGTRCAVPTDSAMVAHAGDSPPPKTCDPGQVSCYSPDLGYCASTESGEQVCEKPAPSDPGGCAAGATGAVCVGKNGSPAPSPSDPPIPKGQGPGSSANYDVTQGGSSTTVVQNNYSGTSPGGSGSSSDGVGTGSNQTGSGNSPGPGGDHGTGTDGKCPDGSVPTASGCSGTATDVGCDTPPQCFGDAVLCASFKEQVAIRCNTKPGSASSSGSYGNVADALAGAGVPADGGASGDPSASGLVSSSDLGEDGFDASGLGFSRTCPANPTFNVLGHSYTLDLTPFCNFAGMLGWFVLLVSMLVALRIVATGKA